MVAQPRRRSSKGIARMGRALSFFSLGMGFRFWPNMLLAARPRSVHLVPSRSASDFFRAATGWRMRTATAPRPAAGGRRPSPVSRLHGCTGAVRHAPNPLCATGSTLVGLYQSIFREFRIIAKRGRLIYNCFWAKTNLQLRMRIYRGPSLIIAQNYRQDGNKT